MPSQTGSIDLKAQKVANDEASKTATNYITADSTGIRIASTNPSTANTYQHQTAISTEFVVEGKTVGQYSGTNAIIGPEDNVHTIIGTSGFSVLDGNNLSFLETSGVEEETEWLPFNDATNDRVTVQTATNGHPNMVAVAVVEASYNVTRDEEIVSVLYNPEDIVDVSAVDSNEVPVEDIILGWRLLKLPSDPEIYLNMTIKGDDTVATTYNVSVRMRTGEFTGRPVFRIGSEEKSHAIIDYQSLRLIDKEGDPYLYISDLRDEIGKAELTEKFSCNGVTTSFSVSSNVSDEVSVSFVPDQTIGYTRSGKFYIFSSAPSAGATLTITYKTTDRIKAYTFGTRTGNIGPHSYAFGIYNQSSGIYSQAFGYRNRATGIASHAEGGPLDLSTNIIGTIASGQTSHAEGAQTTASGVSSHAEGFRTQASGICSHAEGGGYVYSDEYNNETIVGSIASGYCSHAEGNTTIASGKNSHAEGRNSIASSENSHVEGDHATASGNSAHAEGYYTIASETSAHAEGITTTASGDCSHAEGRNTVASRYATHAEGNYSEATANYAHSEGNHSLAQGVASHAQNEGTVAAKRAQTVLGTYNVEDSSTATTHPSSTTDYGDHALIIGNGVDDTNRSNLLTLAWDGVIDQFISSETKVGEDSVSTATNLNAIKLHDAANDLTYYSTLTKNASDDLYRSFIVQRKDANDADLKAGIYIHQYADGTSGMTFTGTDFAKNTRNSLGASSGIWPRTLGGTGVNAKSETTVTLENSSAGDAVAWHNGIVATVTYNGFKLSSSLAANTNINIGTVPSGYRPAGNVWGSTARNGGTGAAIIRITSAGVVTLYNRGSNAIPTTENIYFTITYCI